MSTLYNLEPHPTAKVILKTTLGDVSLELFAKQTPLAARNFLQHCLDGYYNNTIFHRLIPNFIIQGGDPTGTGAGGVSAIDDGAGFQDEFHSRLKFNRRGLLGMANEGKDSNGSQFFLTLGATPELQGRNTMFGRVEGETIYNLMKMGEGELVEGEGSERPLYPTKIVGMEVLVNPFEDMVARVQDAPRVGEDAGMERTKKRKKTMAGRNVLSFGAEEVEEEMAAPVLKKVRANPKLVSVGEEAPEKMNNTAMPKAPAEKKKKKKKKKAEVWPTDEIKSIGDETEINLPPKSAAIPPKGSSINDDAVDEEDEEEQPDHTAKSKSTLERTNAEIEAIKASMKRKVDSAPRESSKPKNALEAMIPATSIRGRKRGTVTDEKGALDVFKAFKERLANLPPAPDKQPSTSTTNHSDISIPAQSNGQHNPDNPPNDKEEDEEADLCDLHFIANCQSCKSWDQPDAEFEAMNGGDGDDEENERWMAHSLTFAKDTLGKDLQWRRKMEEIEVIDPREKARSIKEERRKREKGSKMGRGISSV